MLMRSDGVHLLYDGAVHTIAGESESGKTWLTLIAALQLLEAGVRVIFLDFEDRADRVIGRLMALGATPTQIRANFIYIRPDRPSTTTAAPNSHPTSQPPASSSSTASPKP
jgi:KaiC/GvpD/RAD55 family RecA-like ATPase